jgi:hypothetical protein
VKSDLSGRQIGRLSKRKRVPVRHVQTIDDRAEVDQVEFQTDDDLFGDEPEAGDVTPEDADRPSLHYSKPAPDAYSGIDWTCGRKATGRQAEKKDPFISVLEAESMYRDAPLEEDALSSAADLAGVEPLSLAAIYDGGETPDGGFADFGAPFGTGYIIGKMRSTPFRSLINEDLEKRSRGNLRAAARKDPDAFRAALPADILDRLALPDADDVPHGSPVCHPRLAPSWPRPTLPDWFLDAPQDVDADDLPDMVPVKAPGGRADIGAPGQAPSFSIPLIVRTKRRKRQAPVASFTAAPRIKPVVSPGLAIGEAACSAESCIATVAIHGVKIGLRRTDRKAPELPVWSAPYRPTSGPCRSVKI